MRLRLKASSDLSMMGCVNEKERFELFFGPYEMPRLRPGKWVTDAIRGKVRVGRISDGRIPWPKVFHRTGLIVFGDLERALKEEAGQAVAYHWGVSPTTVQRWKRLIGISGRTAGTRMTMQRILRERYRKQWHAMDARRVPSRQLLRRRGSTQWEVRELQKRGLFAKAWTAGDLKLLGRIDDAELAKTLGRTEGSIKAKRAALGISVPKMRFRVWTAKEHAMLGKASDVEVGRRIARTAASVERRREAFHIRKFDPETRRWTAGELKLLGKVPDAELAKRTGRSAMAVAAKRVLARRLVRTRRNWRPEEIALFGKKSDAEVARMLGRSVHSVSFGRRERRIPATSGREGGRKWTAQELRWLERFSNEEVAQRTGRTVDSAYMARKRMERTKRTRRR